MQLSLEDLSARTKIRPALLGMIEREEFDRLPAGLLTRGFLRAYAREVGVEPEAIVRQYVEEFEPERPLRVPSPPEPEEVEWDSASSGRTRWFVAPAIPLALAAIFFVRMFAAVPPEPARLLGVVDAGQTRTTERAAEIAPRGTAEVRGLRITHTHYAEFLSE